MSNQTDGSLPQSDLHRRLVLDNWLSRGAKAMSWILLLGYLCVASVAHIVDPFGWSAATSDNSRKIVERVLSPWWGWRSGSWRVASDIPSTSVVLFEPQTDEPWPPIFEKQGEAIASIAKMCPRQIVLDVIYDVQREYYKVGLSESLKKIENAAATCSRVPTIIFADEATPDPGDKLVDEAYEFVGGPCAGSDFSMPRSENCAKWMMRGLGALNWDSKELNKDSRYRAVSHEDFYRLYSRREKFGFQTSRPSLALVAYMNHCARLAEIEHAIEGGDGDITDLRQAATGCLGDGVSDVEAPLFDLAHKRFARQAGGVQSGASLPPAVAKLVEAPMALSWARWAPRDSSLFQRGVRLEPKSSFDLLGSRDCITNYPPDVFSRTGQSLRLLILAVFGASPEARVSEISRCYPFMTFLADHHFLKDDCDECDLKRGMLFAAQRDPVHGVAKHIRDRTVFVGFNGSGDGDKTLSPVHGRLPGVFFHAVAFENLVRFGTEYWRPPESNVAQFLDIPIGADTAIEVPLLWVVTLIAFRIRAHQWDVNQRRLRILKRLQRNEGWLHGKARMFGFSASIFLRQTLLFFLLLFALTFSATAITSLIFNWSMTNWIGVSVLSMGTLIALNVSTRHLPNQSLPRGVSIVRLPQNTSPSAQRLSRSAKSLERKEHD